MSGHKASVLQFLKGQEVCQIAFGMYDLQISWGDGGVSCSRRVIYTSSTGVEVVWTEGHPFDAVPLLRLLKQTIEAFDGSSDGGTETAILERGLLDCCTRRRTGGVYNPSSWPAGHRRMT